MKKITSSISAVAMLMLAGCAQLPPPKPLGTDEAQRLQGQSVAKSNAEVPDFVAMTSAKGALGIVGAFAAISEGKELVKANGIEDPAVRILNSLTALLIDKYRLELKSSTSEASGNSIEQIVLAAPAVDLIMDVRTLGWRFGYFPSTWGTYYVAYGVKARLINAKTKLVIAEGTCVTPKAEKNEKSPSYDALVNNGARGLKEELKAVADQCVSELKLSMQL